LHASSQAPRPFQVHPITRELSAHLTALDLFQFIIPNVIPFGAPNLTPPTLWHHEQSGSNIFILETELAKGCILITSVIDWQNTAVGPLYMQACVPHVFHYHAPWNLPKGLGITALPENIEELSEMEQKVVRDDVTKNIIGLWSHAMHCTITTH
jgi:hypothetical protein